MTVLATLDERGFENAITEDDRPILVDFWAPWCGSCRLLAPAVSQLAEELSDELRFAQLDVDAAPDLAREQGVQSIPTLIMYRSGREIARIGGVKSKSALRELLLEHLDAS